MLASCDEINIANKIEIDRAKEQKIGPHKACQCIIVRGLFFSSFFSYLGIYFHVPLKKNFNRYSMSLFLLPV